MVFHHGTSPTQPNPTQAPFFGVFVGIMPKWELLCVLVDPIHISTPPDGSATCRERQRGGGGGPRNFRIRTVVGGTPTTQSGPTHPPERGVSFRWRDLPWQHSMKLKNSPPTRPKKASPRELFSNKHDADEGTGAVRTILLFLIKKNTMLRPH